MHKNREQAAELTVNLNGRRKAEIELEKVTREFEALRLASASQQDKDSREISALEAKVREL